MKNKYKVIDNFLNKKYFNLLKETFLNNFFPWYYQNYKVNVKDNQFQFTHLFYNDSKENSPYLNILNELFEKIKLKTLIRAKVNLTTKNKEIEKFNFHVDTNIKCNTAILYLNTNNGKTVFEEKKLLPVNSVENRIVIFPSHLKHAGTTHTDTDFRLVLNINYY
jgi:hypothetical protein